MDELLFVGSDEDPNIYVFNLQAGATVGSFKGNRSNSHCMCIRKNHARAGRYGSIFAVQAEKAEQPNQKLICGEKLTCVEISNSGFFCVGGTEAGRILIWDLATGDLLRDFDAHFKKINVIRFTSDDEFVIVGSDDANATVWSLGDLVDEDNTQSPRSIANLSHTLPITDIHVGFGIGTCRIITASQDRTCKIWSMTGGICLSTLLLPDSISSITMNPKESKIFAACENGNVYRIDLYPIIQSSEYQRSRMEIMGESVHSGLSQNENTSIYFGNEARNPRVIKLSIDATLLIVGYSSGHVKIFDVISQQCIRTLGPLKGRITNILRMMQPDDLFDSTNSKEFLSEMIPPLRKTRIRFQDAILAAEPRTILMNFTGNLLRDNLNVTETNTIEGVDNQLETIDLLTNRNKVLENMTSKLYDIAVEKVLR